MSAAIRYAVEAPRTNEMCAWLLCNDIDPHDVPLKSEVFVESDAAGVWSVRHAVYVRSESGMIRYDPATLKYAYDWRSVPLQNDPPMRWLVEQTEEAASTGEEAASTGSH